MKIENQQRRLAKLRHQIAWMPANPNLAYREEWSRTADGATVFEIHFEGGGSFAVILEPQELDATAPCEQ